MPGFEKLMKGILRYRKELQPRLLEQFKQIKDNPDPKAVVVSCMDSRVLVTKMLQSDVGDMFVVRNAGALVPHADNCGPNCMSTEPGAIELACVNNNIKNVIVVGHSDCKAMNLLYSIKEDVKNKTGGPLQLWLKNNCLGTVQKYNTLEEHGFKTSLYFQGETPEKQFEAIIDPNDKFALVDKFSQVNTLQQIQNIASHSFLTEKLRQNEVHLHAMWFDVFTGDFYLFSRKQKQFVEVDESSSEELMREATA